MVSPSSPAVGNWFRKGEKMDTFVALLTAGFAAAYMIIIARCLKNV